MDSIASAMYYTAVVTLSCFGVGVLMVAVETVRLTIEKVRYFNDLKRRAREATEELRSKRDAILGPSHRT